jgi:hypothetical protein
MRGDTLMNQILLNTISKTSIWAWKKSKKLCCNKWKHSVNSMCSFFVLEIWTLNYRRIYDWFWILPWSRLSKRRPIQSLLWPWPWPFGRQPKRMAAVAAAASFFAGRASSIQGYKSSRGSFTFRDRFQRPSPNRHTTRRANNKSDGWSKVGILTLTKWKFPSTPMNDEWWYITKHHVQLEISLWRIITE